VTPVKTREGVYVASKSRHGPLWLGLRERGFPVTSSWIDEWGPRATASKSESSERCLREAAESRVMLFYIHGNDMMFGAVAEWGAAASHGRHVFVVQRPGSSGCHWMMTSHPLVHVMDTLGAALEAAADAVNVPHNYRRHEDELVFGEHVRLSKDSVLWHRIYEERLGADHRSRPCPRCWGVPTLRCPPLGDCLA
jgi:hypothetical protein